MTSSTRLHRNTVFAIAAVLLLFFGVASILVISHQRALLLDVQHQAARNELALMEAVVREAMLRHDYATVEAFLTRWGMEQSDVVSIRGLAPNGFALASYRRETAAATPYSLTYRVMQGDELLLALELTKDFTDIERNLDALGRKIAAWSSLFIAVFGLLLWYTLRRTAMLPLEREIAERNKVVAALRESETRYRMLFESAGDAIFILEAEGERQGTIVAANKAAAEMHGYGIDELSGMNIRELDAPDAAQALPDRMRRILAGEWIRTEIGHRKKDGTEFPLELSAGLLELGGKKHVLAFERDIADRKAAERKLRRFAEELREANEEVKNFATIVSHDLRAPLISIKGFSGELRESLREVSAIVEQGLAALDERDRARALPLINRDIPESLDFIASAISRMDGLIASILALSRIGRGELKPEAIDMNELVGAITASLAHQLEQRRAQVVVGALPGATADRISMERIVGNLLDNAVKYLDPGRPGTIELSGERTAEETIYRISDNGRGIAPIDIAKVFDIFRRAGRQDQPGDGMGLAYVKALVKRLGGRIWCESEEGKGSVFSFALPAAPENGNGAEGRSGRA